MGRQAKLRQLRKQSERSQPVSATPTKEVKRTQSKGQSLFGKFLKRLNPFSKEGEDLSWLEEEQNDLEENNRRASAIARKGYQQQKRGFVFAQESQESAPQLEYIPRGAIEKTLRQHGVEPEDHKAITDLVNSYDPEQSFILVYRDRDGEISISNYLLSAE